MCFRVVVGILVVTAVAGLVIWLSEDGGTIDSPISTASTANSATPVDKSTRLLTSDRSDFVGNHVCSKCHSDIAANYRRNPMSRSWTDVSTSVPDDVQPAASVSDVSGHYSYQVCVENNRLVQRETTSDGSHQLTAVAEYVVGSGNHARALVSATDGYLKQLPLGWFAREGTWKLNPGYELNNHRFDRPVVAGCLACHGAFAEPDIPAGNHFQLPATDGIRCEQCHGPGRPHVDFHRRTTDLPLTSQSDPIIQPDRLNARAANDICLQCHLQGDVTIYREGADAFSFRPGDRLSDHRLDFLIQTADADTFGVASHGARLVQSRCYSASEGRLKCFLCHDPHRPVSDFSLSFHDQKCLDCHTPESCERDLTSGEVRGDGGCVQCHMPRRRTREGQHLVFTDHWIQKPPAESSDASRPPVLAPNSDVTLINLWPQDDPQGAFSGMAYVELHTSMGPQLPALARGLELLKTAHVRNPADRLATYWLASGQVAAHQSADAVNHLTELLKQRPDWHEARFRLAIALHQMNRSSEAIAAYESIIRAVPTWMAPYPLVVRLYLLKKDSVSAERILRQQLAVHPEATAWLNLALTHQMSGRPLEDSLASVQKSLALDPRNVTAYLTRAYLFAVAGQRENAISDYRQTLQIEPGNRDALAGLRAAGEPD
ncbi:MAG: tetratricopeptide repeat protein [Planctomycetaceae bacterium]